MKLIIDIDEGDYKWIKDHVMTVNEQRIANGIPLDKIRAELINKSNEPNYLHEDEDWSVGLEMALEIIDTYKAERNEE